MNKLFIGAAFIAAGLAAASAAAQVAPPPGVAAGTTPLPLPGTHRPPIIRSPVPAPLAGRVLTRDDVVRHVRALFARLDTNHDGFLTRSEIAAVRNRIMAGARGPRAEDRGRAPAGAMAMGDAAAMFDRIDTNHDGVISRQEFMTAHERMNARMMSGMRGMSMMDRAGGIGPMKTPMSASGEAHDMHFLMRIFERADVNHDGRVSLEEAEAAALARFDQMDLNHDGRLTPDERRRGRMLIRERTN